MTKLSHIVVRQPKTPTHDGGLMSCQRARITELQAGQSDFPTKIPELVQEVYYWERVVMQPQHYPHVRHGLVRPLQGHAKIAWIAQRMGLSYREARSYLIDD